MKRGPICIPAIACAMLLLVLSVRDQKTEWEALTEQAKSLSRQGKYVEAIKIAGNALAIAEQDKGLEHPDVAASLNNIAWLYNAQGQYAASDYLAMS